MEVKRRNELWAGARPAERSGASRADLESMARSRSFLGLSVLIVGGLCAGCVERRLFVRSDPPGAKVFLDGEPMGETPIQIPFTFYGTREVHLRAEKHEPRRLAVALDPPWWQLTPIDFFAEVLYPGTIVDERSVDLALTRSVPASATAVAGLKARAEERRRGP